MKMLIMLLSLLGSTVLMANTQEPVYKVMWEREFQQFQQTGEFHGSRDDMRDGFIHMSPANQIERIVKKYFPGERPIYIIKFSKKDFLELLVWEPAASGGLYPHLYNRPLLLDEVESVQKIEGDYSPR